MITVLEFGLRSVVRIPVQLVKSSSPLLVGSVSGLSDEMKNGNPMCYTYRYVLVKEP